MAAASVNGIGGKSCTLLSNGLAGGDGRPAVPDYFVKILKNKDRIIRVQAKRIELLESEVERLRVARETMSTQLALVSYKLELATATSSGPGHSWNAELQEDLLLQTADGLPPDCCKYVCIVHVFWF